MEKIKIPDDDNELLKQCIINTFRATGSGGQHVNTTDSAVRLVHIPTGIVIISQKERSQYLNKKDCLSKLRKKISQLNYRKPKRVATKVPFSVKIKNREKKVKDSKKKHLRKTASEESE